MNRILSIFLSLSALSVSGMPLSLKECKERALATDENIRIMENNIAGADLDVGVAKTQYLPKLSGNANVFYMAPDTKVGDMMSMQIHGAYMAGISLAQPIYAGGKIRAGNKMTKVGKEITEEQLKAERMDLLAEAEKSYWTYVAVLSKVKMTESYLAMMDSIYEVSKDAVEVGLQAPQTLLRVNTRRSELIYRLNQAKAGADICRLAICKMIGVDDTTSIQPVEPIFTDTLLPEMLTDVSQRPETRILAQMIDLKRHEVDLVRGDFLPTVGVQLGWSAYGNMKMKGWSQDMQGNPIPFTSTISSNGFMGILAVQIPLFHWGEGIKKVKRAKIEVENARLSLEKNRRMMELQASQTYSNLYTGIELIRSSETAMDEAEENLRMMKEQYEVGLITLTDLLEAQSQWQSSYSSKIEAHTQFRINKVEYLRAIGKIE